MAKAPAVKWTREHFLVALNLYCKLPFGKLHKGNPIIIETASKMGRTPNSLAMKLCNFAALDPVQQARGVRGLPGATKQDRVMWNEFHSNLSTLGTESEELLHDMFTKDETKEVDFLTRDKVRLVTPSGPTETHATIKVRRGQQFFRQTILNIYRRRCCVSDIAVPELLVASHILPWSKFPEERLNPQNGLCLSSIHDAAFDCGLVSFDDKLCLILSKELEGYFPHDALEKNFTAYAGKKISETDKLSEPKREFLEYHRKEIFRN